MPSPIGGNFISSYGGALGFRPFQGLLPSAGAPPSIEGRTLLDVARWELQRLTFTDDTTHTGSGGAQGVDVACLGFNLAAELIWDLYVPPNFLASCGALAASGVGWNNGFQFWAYVGAGQNSPVPVGPYYYFSPSVKTRLVSTIIDAGGKKMVRARIDVVGNSPLFAFGGQLNEQALYDAYIAHCLLRNWVW
jgi:hypothetical protein